MLNLHTAPPKLKLANLVRKANQWYRIGLAAHKLKHVKEAEREQAQRALSQTLAEARGLAMKIGQFMAGIDDASNAYHNLVSSITPLPLSLMRQSLSNQLQQDVETVFSQLDEATAAASLGQVHHAYLHNGAEVAVKIRYPGIVEMVQAELAISDHLPTLGPAKQWRVNTKAYKNTLRRQLLRETDYLLEMQTQQRLQKNINVQGLIIPSIHNDLCREGVLVQSWENGVRFHEACHWPLQDRLEIGKILLLTLVQSLFVAGEIHGDPHPGNYLFRHDNGKPQVVLLDFGCTVLISKQQRLALLKLIDLCRNASHYTSDDLLSCFAALGFDAKKLSHIQAELPQVCHALLQPFLATRPFTIKQWQLAATLKDLLGEKRWWFRSAGPAELFLLLRAFHGLNQQLEKLDIALPWYPLLQYAVGEALLLEARNLKLPAIDLKIHQTATYDKARKLCVRLTENDIVQFSVDLPAEAAFDLDNIIPDQVLVLLATHSDINLMELSQRLKKQGLLAQNLLKIAIDNKCCQLWLE